MKLNLDCIRDILIVIENEQQMEFIDQSFVGEPDDESGMLLSGRPKAMYSDELLKNENLKKYTPDDILYSIRQMIENGLLDDDDETITCGITIYCISDITPHGHEFISNLQSSNAWEKLKSKLKVIGGASLTVIAKIAAEEAIKHLI